MKEKMGRRSFLKTAAATAVLTLTCKKSNETSAGNQETAVKNKMPKKKLGSTGVDVPILCQGTSQIMNPVYDKVLHLCYREGVTGIDTALSYGWGASHLAVSKFFEQIKNRKKIFLTSKSSSSSPNGLIKDLNKCLNQLNTDYLDLYLMHGLSGSSMLKSSIFKAGDKMRKSGKTRFFGLSTHSNSAYVMKEAAKTGGIDAILFRYNFRDFGDKELNLAIDACKKAGIGLIAMKTMGSFPDNDAKVVKYKSKNFTIAQAKLKAVWDDERIDVIVSEMSSISEARENIAAAKSDISLSSKEMHQLNRLAAKTANLSCSGCSGICESEMKGETKIVDILRYLMYYESYGKQDLARNLYNRLPADSKKYTVKDISNARKVCPQGIDIAVHLSRAEKKLEA